MKALYALSVAGMLVGVLMCPLPALAQTGISFGGEVIAEEPCISPLGPSIFVTIIPAGAFPATYIWTPATITNMVGPPILGGQIIGVADVPYFCWSVVRGGFLGFFNIFSYSYGLRMQYIGTSAPFFGV